MLKVAAAENTHEGAKEKVDKKKASSVGTEKTCWGQQPAGVSLQGTRVTGEGCPGRWTETEATQSPE